MYKAIVVDDHPFIRAIVKIILKDLQFEVVAEADNGSDAVQLAHEHAPDLVLLDITMPMLDGLTVLGRLYTLSPSVKIIVLTSQAPSLFALRCMKAGAWAYVSKTNGLNELARAIHTVMSGRTFFPILTVNSVRKGDVLATERELIHSLTEREIIILQHLANGVRNKQISEHMLLSSQTISTYKARVFEKLNVSSLVQLADLARRNNLI